MFFENQYRTKTCAALSEVDVNNCVKVAGWVENVRDHGGVLFVDLRDHYGLVQVVIHDDAMLSGVMKECVVSVEGPVVLRDLETVNAKLATGTIEITAKSLEIIGKSQGSLPFEVPNSPDVKEELRLKYRFLDLRNQKMQDMIKTRARLLSFLRNRMTDLGFIEVQTPILSASSPEGARDYLIPARKHPGKFYALPQAPQIFKQLLMVSGIDRYFQIAPCFRDEDARADRSPGEFYQLDFEMAFATQEEVLTVAETVLYDVFKTFSDKPVTPPAFPRITYKEAMLRYGSDKPDLRNPLEIVDVSDIFSLCSFAPFQKGTVRAIRVPDCGSQPRSFFEQMLEFATSIGMKGLGYVKAADDLALLGPIDKFVPVEQKKCLIERSGLQPNDVLYFISDKTELVTAKLAGQIRNELGRRLELLSDDFKMCFIIDFPMYELDDVTHKVGFTHNPFSMPQGGLEALNKKDPLEILAWQYDIVCNGVELSSGAVRNHDRETMVRAFEIAGYGEQTVKDKFGSLYNAFAYGAPPHAGMAPGVDRMLMLLANESSIREVIAFPMTANAEDLMMGAPTPVAEKQLREAHIKVR
ncbi:MAG TPA: aspartate--tRNA ligase [Clostridia bacterium]|nr:aspartate--tRNA ligase [Clostridia bacterium]